MRIIISTIAFVCLSVFSYNSYADEVIFENGERLIGTFKKVEGDKLIFKSEIAGEISVDLSKIREIASDELLEILLEDGTLLRGKTIKREEGIFTVQEEKEEEGQTFVKANLYDIYPAPRPKVKWSGNISAGFKSSHGSSFSEDTTVDFGFRLRTKKHRFRSSGWLIIERAEDSEGEKYTTDENFTIRGHYSYFFTEKIFGYWSERFKKDHIDDLEYRLTSVCGAVYQCVVTDKLDFATYGGPGYLQEKYDSRVPNPRYTEERPTRQPKWLKDVQRRNDIIFQTGYHFEWKPLSKIHFNSNTKYNPSIDDWGEYNLTHDSEVRIFINSKIYFTYKFILDYDSDPGEDSSTTDTDHILGLGLKF
jgi:putative salt-induced outer membrane protein YdiY